MEDIFLIDRSDDTLERLIFDGHALQNALTEMHHTVGAIDLHSGMLTKLQLRLTLGQLLSVRRDLDQVIGKVGQLAAAQVAEPKRRHPDLVLHSGDCRSVELLSSS